MKLYVGRRTGQAADITVEGRPLNPRLDLWNHSPTGFEWGYAGSGPAQLALALLADALGDQETALEWHQDYKKAIIAGLPYRGWTLTEDEIRSAIDALQASGRREDG